MAEESTATPQRSLFFTKQPILDAKRSIWGYELLGWEVEEGIFEVFPQRESASSLSSTTYVGLQEAMERGKKILVAFDEASILSGMPHALPPSYGAVRVVSGTSRVPGLEGALQALRSEGYLTVLEVTPAAPLPAAISDQADILSFDLSAASPDPTSSARGRKGDSMMLARGVKTLDQFQTARDLGFALFQGSFFKEPEYVRDRKLSSSEVSRLNLLRLMETEDPDFKALATAIRSDVAISFRLLSYLNSAYFGFRHNIQSIDQAIMLLGWLKLKSWLRAVILLDMAGKNEGPMELAALSLQRGKFFELLATDYDYWGFNPSTLFLVGLFSLMDTILGMPMDSVAELLPLDAKLKAALRRDPNNEYQPLFGLLDSLEDADWPTLETLTHKLCLDLERVKDFFAQARDWAGGFFLTRG